MRDESEVDFSREREPRGRQSSGAPKGAEDGTTQRIIRRKIGVPAATYSNRLFTNPLPTPSARPVRLGSRRGLSLMEAVVSTVLVGVLLIAALRTVGASVFTQRQSAERAAGQMLADGLMAEILAKSYKDPGNSPQFGRESGESSASKTAYDDVDDYEDWSESPPQFADGGAMPDLAGWQRSVSVDRVDPADLTRTLWSETGAKRITVSVQHTGVTVATRVAVRTEVP